MRVRYPKCSFVQIDNFNFTATQNGSTKVCNRTQSSWLWYAVQRSNYFASKRKNEKIDKNPFECKQKILINSYFGTFHTHISSRFVFNDATK